MEGEMERERGEEEDWAIDRKQDNSGTTKGNKMEQKPNYINGDAITILYLYTYSIGANSHHNFTEKERVRKWRRFDSVYIEKKDSGIN